MLRFRFPLIHTFAFYSIRISLLESFCQDPAILPIVQGILDIYEDDPFKAIRALNYYFETMSAVKERQASSVSHADQYRAVVIRANWNVRSLPAFLVKTAYCQVSRGDNVAWILTLT